MLTRLEIELSYKQWIYVILEYGTKLIRTDIMCFYQF